VETYPEVVTPITVGRTYEGRQIRGVKVSFKEGNRGVVLEGGAGEIRLNLTQRTHLFQICSVGIYSYPVIPDVRLLQS
jgi:hypothetical protein